MHELRFREKDLYGWLRDYFKEKKIMSTSGKIKRSLLDERPEGP